MIDINEDDVDATFVLWCEAQEEFDMFCKELEIADIKIIEYNLIDLDCNGCMYRMFVKYDDYPLILDTLKNRFFYKPEII